MRYWPRPRPISFLVGLYALGAGARLEGEGRGGVLGDGNRLHEAPRRLMRRRAARFSALNHIRESIDGLG